MAASIKELIDYVQDIAEEAASVKVGDMWYVLYVPVGKKDLKTLGTSTTELKAWQAAKKYCKSL